MPNLSSGNGSPGPSLLHQAFLERAADTSAGGGDLALGAFLTLRMVDQFGAAATPNREALRYQVRATQDFVHNLPGGSPELNHLRQIARVGEQVLKKNEARFLWSPMLAYAYWLEQELRLGESLDVLDTALGLDTKNDSAEQLAAHLERGRVLRLAGDFDRAMTAYETGGTLALRLSDHHSERASRIGRAIVQSKLGNLRGSEEGLRGVMDDARAAGDRDSEARAHHDLAITLELMDRATEGIPLAFRAYELYEQPTQQLKALQVVGMLMKAVGNYAAADDAFAMVMAGNPAISLRQDTMLEMLDVAARAGDRVAFERWRRELDHEKGKLPADAYVDFETKMGQGFAIFDQPDRAREALESAVRRAEQHKLNKYLFRAEAALKALTQKQERDQRRAQAVLSAAHVTAVDEIAEKLQLLRTSA